MGHRKYLAVLALPALCCSLAVGAHAVADTPAHPYAASQTGAEVCFPFRKWDAPSIDNVPCDVLPAPQEDGSGPLYLGTLSNDLARCTIPNVKEERGTFTITCQRIHYAR